MHRRLLISVPFLSTGGALAVFISHGDLPAGRGRSPPRVLVTGAVSLGLDAIAGAFSGRSGPSQALRGIAAGLLATAAYDLCRFTVVSLTDIAYWPFDAFSRFGRLLAGEAAPALVWLPLL